MSFNHCRDWNKYIVRNRQIRKQANERLELAKMIKSNCEMTSPAEQINFVWLKVLHVFNSVPFRKRIDTYIIKGVYHEMPDWKMFPLPYNCIKVSIERSFDATYGGILCLKESDNELDKIKFRGAPRINFTEMDCDIKEFLGLDIAISHKEAIKRGLI